ncbi:MAG: hypothetical protein NC548_05635 [Lachnospiraceae bacterium]|nr:hypothetical protein [Lachnospiraceae bacterium]
MAIVNTMESARIEEYASKILERYAKYMPDGKYIDDHCDYDTRIDNCSAIGLTLDGKVVCLVRDTQYFSVNPIELRPRNHDNAVETATFGTQEYAPHLSTWACGGVIHPGPHPWSEIIAEYNKSLAFPRMCIISVYEF